MGKASLRKKYDGLLKQTRKHIAKFKEAETRGDVGSMDYMGKEMSNFLKQMDKIKKQMAPKKK